MEEEQKMIKKISRGHKNKKKQKKKTKEGFWCIITYK